MPKTKSKKVAKTVNEPDSTYFLKLVLYLIVGSVWIKINRGTISQIPLPIGLLIGLLFASHEHFQIDRKVEYAVLLIAMLVGFWLPLGIYIGL